MKNEKGFTLIELLIVVAIIGIIAAIAIPSLLRARVSANEAAAIGDSRTVISGEAAYNSANSGFYGHITCLNRPSSCINNYTAAAPTFLDGSIAAAGSYTKQGYVRSFTPGPNAAPDNTGAVAGTSINIFCYGSKPSANNKTGVRSFGGDDGGVVASTNDGTVDCCVTGAMVAGCTALR